MKIMKIKTKITFTLLIFILFFLVNVEITNAQNENYQLEAPIVCSVQSGDTLWRIARRFKVDFKRLKESNTHLENPDLIYPDDKIYLPEEEDNIEKDVILEDEVDEQEFETDETDSTLELEARVVELVNQQREAAGLRGYRHNTKLSEVAREKSEDMRDNNYFSHQSPNYGSPFEMMDKFNIRYQAAGENIAQGQRSAEAVVDAWMDSPGHRRNILSNDFTEIGVGYAETEQSQTFWTQMFIRP